MNEAHLAPNFYPRRAKPIGFNFRAALFAPIARRAYEATRLFSVTRDNNRFISPPAARSVLFAE